MSVPSIASWNIRGFNSPDKVYSCKRLISAFQLDLLCILETRILLPSLLNPFFCDSHVLFPAEGSCHNFNLATPGRIWIKWNASKINFTPTSITPQSISGLVEGSNFTSFLLTAVYADNERDSRILLWDSIKNLVIPPTQPWILLDDWNCCRFATDKMGGSSLTHNNLGELNSLIFDTNLEEMNSVGNNYTWFNQRISNPIHIKLDRVFVNGDWITSFPSSYYSVQAPSCSDHCPLVIHSPKISTAHHRFLFKNYWTNIDAYWFILLDVFSTTQIGNPLADFCLKLRTLKKRLKLEPWTNAKAVYEHLDSLLNLQSFYLDQISVDSNNNGLNCKLKDVNDKISTYTSLKVSWIIQRAKAAWLTQGEDDLKFLYAKIRKRRASSNAVVNYATSTNSLNADAISDILNHFQLLYNPASIQDPNVDLFPVGETLNSTDADFLISSISDVEIKNAVYEGKASSSPGPDGFNFHFYKRSWHIIGPSVCKAVKFFFNYGNMPVGIKSTALALIPKTKNAASFADFRPIALCNVIYKIISKVIANRLKLIMPCIVKNNQSGFIKHRISTDNIILAQDILTYAVKGKRNVFCAKFDIRKAFDTISRDFILARLHQKGFPTIFINWIKNCIYDVNFSIMIKGALEGYFHSSAGLRQGCPLSPYLFCIAMDALSSLLDNNDFKGVTHNNFKLTHLLYADDLLVFGEVSTVNCSHLLNTLNCFTNSTGLHINLDKSSILMPKHLASANDIQRALGLSFKDTVTYLGVPISFRSLNIADVAPLLDDITKKFSGWNAKLLSFAGRIQFLKYTMINSIAYWIRGAILPKAAFKFFRKIASKFLFFGDHNAGKKLHLVSWDKVCLPKDKGGLGIFNFNALIHCYNCSLIYRIYNSNSLLADWVLKYYSSPWKPPHSRASKYWKNICATAAVTTSNWIFKINKSSQSSFLWDHWCNNNRLVDLNPELVNYVDCPVNTFIDEDGFWHFPISLSNDLTEAISSVFIFDSISENITWSTGTKPTFKDYCKNYFQNLPNCSWADLIWHKKHSLRFSSYSWLALVGGLKTATALHHRNIVVDLHCSLCHSSPESTSHLYFECNFSHSILSCLIPESAALLMRPNLMQMLDWVNENDSFSSTKKKLYFFSISCLIYFIWRERNERRFKSNASSTTTVKLKINRVISTKVSKWHGQNRIT
ncbi:hypothetical protein KFK09_024999 [Dendrobium nobile]|uniref:Reverse transcriptase domain-containing protein n=1 Tax=Dendrobium nobile TaxID=94219 RepID=A0A8T3AFG3_DENNO|nr:hypothetical protein KFK09_024999 [Dendrobium nobile]